MKNNRNYMVLVGTALLVGLLIQAAWAMPVPCNLGTLLSGGTSDPTTVMGSFPFNYTVYGTDKDQPQAGGPEVMDRGIWVKDHVINSMSYHNEPQTQGDDVATGKRTFFVGGSAVPTPGNYIDQFQFNDGNPASDLEYYFADDPCSTWYNKGVTVIPGPGG